MFIEDLKEEFYKVVTGKRILLLVNSDVDALCSCKILQALFKTDNTLYTIVPVEHVEELVTAYHDHKEQVKYVLLVNCGGTIDVVETLQPDEQVVIFIVDTHKPTDVCNIYSSGQVRLLGKPDDEEVIPDFDEIFRDSDTEEEEEEEEDQDEDEETGLSKRRRLAEEVIEKRRERRLWEEKRNRLMFEYTKFSYYGRSSAVTLFELVWHLGKDTLDTLWWAIVGVTNHLTLGLIPEKRYSDELHVLQLHMSRLVTADQSAEERPALKLPSAKITSQKDLRLTLYRHWTVQASLRHTMCTAIRLRLWTVRGEKRLLQLLAEMGLPLAHSRQNFMSMDVGLRHEFPQMMEKVAASYDMDELLYTSFTLTYGYRVCFQASDVVYLLLGLLDWPGRNKAAADCFGEALEALSRNKLELCELGLERVKKTLTGLFKQLQTLLDMKQVACAGPFLYFVIQEGSLDSRMLANWQSLCLLARATLRAYSSVQRNRRLASLPLIASAPAFPDPAACLVVGVPPVSEPLPRSFFGKAFTQAADTINIHIQASFFDSSVVKIKTEDRPNFLDALTTILS